MERHQDVVIRTVEERDIRFVRLWFCDVLGTLKSIAISPSDLENAFTEGIGIDGSAIEGLTREYESDMLLRPDPATFELLPWRGEVAGTGRMMCDVLTPDGQPAASDPRRVLKDAIARAEAKGLEFFTHPEIEFYLFERGYEPGQPLRPVDSAGYFDHVHRASGQDFRRTVIQYLEAMNIQVEYSHHENGPGQNEIDLRYADALTTADNILTFRTVVKEVALSMGQVATFMPKPMIDNPGSGMHTHLSLFQNGRNAFHEPGAEYGLSRTGRQFIAGLLRHAPEYCAVTSQFVNSYKRLWGAQEAPSYVCWGHNNRSALVRVPFHKPTKGTSSRVEFRGADSAANPYLAFAVLLAAGLAGIDGEYDLPEGAEDTVWQLTDRERRALGYEPLPTDLFRALETFESSELMAETLGEQVFEYFLRNKHVEWDRYREQVTSVELDATFYRI
ncbi:glutamine synthetase family protein [Brachybacterium huguangmaarense]|uniref:Glutamine synthetase family protein n=1 Tax=Brachybacterium huguangmaarense TaxID=1652028 RepID=A0ABY6FZ86_9MICO|nr:glutamine synthetase family protein [Brachybacterium huguangmaarense]UYG16265.1 glutamine synthetase family protein [Brachybacterium huguangmaarense]